MLLKTGLILQLSMKEMEKEDLFTIKKRCINSLASKLIISAKRLGKRLTRIITDIFAVIGVIVMVAEAASEIFGYNGLLMNDKTELSAV